jgi:hypothetical protein
MTATTIRHVSPAAIPRTGRGVAALPNDPGLEALLADKGLSSTAKLVATVLVKHWAWVKSSCYPCNRSIALRCGYSPGHVARCLHELERAGWIRREQRGPGSRLIWLAWRTTQAPCSSAGGGSAALQGDPPAKARTELVVSVTTNGIEPDAIQSPERSRQGSRHFIPPVASLMGTGSQPLAVEPAPTPAPRDPGDGLTAIKGSSAIALAVNSEPAPPPLAPPAEASPAPVPALPPSAEVGPREARPAIPATPAGPTPRSAPGPVPGDRAAPAEIDPRQSPASPPCALRLARTRSSPSEPPSDHCPPVLVAAREPCPGLARIPRVEPPRSAPVPATSPARAGPAPVLPPEQKARLDALPEATANLVLTWLLSADRILVAEARKKLAPPPRRPEAPRSVRETLERIREDPSYPALAASGLCRLWSDQKSFSGFKSRLEDAWRGDIPVAQLLSAFDQATGPKVKKPGALFMYAVRQNE